MFLAAFILLQCYKKHLFMHCSYFGVISIFLHRHQNVHEAKLLQPIMLRRLVHDCYIMHYVSNI